MPDADILLDVNSIELRDGDVSISESLSLKGDLTISDQNGNTVVRIKTDGTLEVTTPNNSQKIVLGHDGIRFYNATGNLQLLISNAGAASFVNTDITMLGSSDIKLDGQYLANRLNIIEDRLSTGGL